MEWTNTYLLFVLYVRSIDGCKLVHTCWKTNNWITEIYWNEIMNPANKIEDTVKNEMFYDVFS